MFAKAKQWTMCLEFADALTRISPTRRSGWIKRAVSLEELGRTGESITVLVECLDLFKDDIMVPYYLAVFWGKIGNPMEARRWLAIALARAKNPKEAKEWKLRALDESALEGLWKEIGDED